MSQIHGNFLCRRVTERGGEKEDENGKGKQAVSELKAKLPGDLIAQLQFQCWHSHFQMSTLVVTHTSYSLHVITGAGLA